MSSVLSGPSACVQIHTGDSSSPVSNTLPMTDVFEASDILPNDLIDCDSTLNIHTLEASGCFSTTGTLPPDLFSNFGSIDCSGQDLGDYLHASPVPHASDLQASAVGGFSFAASLQSPGFHFGEAQPVQPSLADSLSSLVAFTEGYTQGSTRARNSKTSSLEGADSGSSPEKFLPQPECAPSVLPIPPPRVHTRKKPCCLRSSREERERGGSSRRRSSGLCVVCGQTADGRYFGAVVCLPCKSFYIRCTRQSRPDFRKRCNGKCDVANGNRPRCAFCRFQKCLALGMCRKEKPDTVIPAEDQVLCSVCGDIANGVHFGVQSCEGCKKFFRRSLVEHHTYVCNLSRKCPINPRMRTNCRYCRFQKCLNAGMYRGASRLGRPKKGLWSQEIHKHEKDSDGDKKPTRRSDPGQRMDKKMTAVTEDASALLKTGDSTDRDRIDVLSEELLDALSQEVARDVSQDTPASSSIPTGSCPGDKAANFSTIDASELSLSCGGLLTSSTTTSISDATDLQYFLSCSPFSDNGYSSIASSEPSPSSASLLLCHQPAPIVLGIEATCNEREDITDETKTGKDERAAADTVEPTDLYSNKHLLALSSISFALSSSQGNLNTMDDKDGRGEVVFIPQNQNKELQSITDKVANPREGSSVPHDQKKHFLSKPKSVSTSCWLPPYRRNHSQNEEKQNNLVSRHSADESHYLLPETKANDIPSPSVTPSVCDKSSNSDQRPERNNTVSFRRSSLNHRRFAPRNFLQNRSSQKLCTDDVHKNMNLRRSNVCKNRQQLQRNSHKLSRDDSGTVGITLSDSEAAPKPNVKRQKLSSWSCVKNHCEKNVEQVSTSNTQDEIPPQCMNRPERQQTRNDVHTDSQDSPRHVQQDRWVQNQPPPCGQHGATDFENQGRKVTNIYPDRFHLTGPSSEFSSSAFSSVLNQNSQDLQEAFSSSAKEPSTGKRKRRSSFVPSSNSGQNFPTLFDGYQNYAEKQNNKNGLAISKKQNNKNGLAIPGDDLTNTSVQSSVKSDYIKENDIAKVSGCLARVSKPNNSVCNDEIARQDGIKTKPSTEDGPPSTNTSSGISGNSVNQNNYQSAPCRNRPISTTLGNCFPQKLSCSVRRVAQPVTTRQFHPQHPEMTPHCSLSWLQSSDGNPVPQMLSTNDFSLSDHTNTDVRQYCDKACFSVESSTRRACDVAGIWAASSHMGGCSYGYERRLDRYNGLPLCCRLCTHPCCAQRDRVFPSRTNNDVYKKDSPVCVKIRDNISSESEKDFPDKRTPLSFSFRSPTVLYPTRSTASLSVDEDTLGEISLHFLNMKNTCKQYGCNENIVHDDCNTCSDMECRVCNLSMSEDVMDVTAELQPWEICPRRHHLYWHRTSASEGSVPTDTDRQQSLFSVLNLAFCHLKKAIDKLHKNCTEDLTDRNQEPSRVMLEMLYYQERPMATLTKQFMMKISDKLPDEDLTLLSARYAFDCLLLLLSCQHYDSACQRFRLLWTWSPTLTGGLQAFQSRLWTTAGVVNGMGLDQSEAVLLCALALFRTDVPGLQNKGAVEEVRTLLVQALHTYVSARDQWCNVRIRRLFNVMPDVRLLSSWRSAILLHTDG